MGFWDIFVNVWQVRTSIRIQENLEEAFRESKSKAQTEANIKEIVDELHVKNESWYKQLNYHRNKSK
jgi:hypothetical protein